jgi:hypothetical protein
MFCTASVIVLSAAKAGAEAIKPTRAKTGASNLVTGHPPFLRVEKKRAKKVESDCDCDQQGGNEECGLDQTVRQWTSANSFGAGRFGRPMDEPRPGAKTNQGYGDEDWLVGGKPGELTDPCPAYADAE